MKNLINLAILSEKAGAKIILMECVYETAKLITPSKYSYYWHRFLNFVMGKFSLQMIY